MPGELAEAGSWFSCSPEASRLGAFSATGEGGPTLPHAVRTLSTGVSPAWAGAATPAPSVRTQLKRKRAQAARRGQLPHQQHDQLGHEDERQAGQDEASLPQELGVEI